MESIKLYGVNIGGFLSQIEDYSLSSVINFITVHDFRKIRDWGFNTIRLAVDFPFLFKHSSSLSEHRIYFSIVLKLIINSKILILNYYSSIGS